jgi:hypothetical protein
MGLLLDLDPEKDSTSASAAVLAVDVASYMDLLGMLLGPCKGAGLGGDTGLGVVGKRGTSLTFDTPEDAEC